MPLKRSSEQANKTLDAFYSDMISGEKSDADIKVGNGMLAFIKMADETFIETELFGLTSHGHMVIHPEDNWDLGLFVTIAFSAGGEYFFEFPMPEDQSPPWKHATIKGMATNLSEARNYLIIALNQSQGWKGNTELERLFKAI